MLRFSTLMALLMAFVFLTGVSFQAGATTPDTILKSGQAAISDAGSSRLDSIKLDNTKLDSNQADDTARIRLAAPKLNPNAPYKGSPVTCSERQCKRGRVNFCRITHYGGRRCTCSRTNYTC
jgi:hypothetical protein